MSGLLQPHQDVVFVQDVYFAARLPEMLKTNDQGTTIVITTESLSLKEIEKPQNIVSKEITLNNQILISFLKIQYNTARKHPAFMIRCATLKEAPIKRHTYTCQGGKGYEYLNPFLFSHDEVTPDLLTKMVKL